MYILVQKHLEVIVASFYEFYQVFLHISSAILGLSEMPNAMIS